MRYEKRLLRRIKLLNGVETVGSRSIPARLAVDLGLVGHEQEIEDTLAKLAKDKKIILRRLAGPNSPICHVSCKEEPKAKAKFSNNSRPSKTTEEKVMPKKNLIKEVSKDKPQNELSLDGLASTRAECLTIVLHALQKSADQATGDLTTQQVNQVLRNQLFLTERAAKRALELLGDLGVRISWKSGFQQTTHQVDMKTQAITNEMIEDFKAKQADARKSAKGKGSMSQLKPVQSSEEQTIPQEASDGVALPSNREEPKVSEGNGDLVDQLVDAILRLQGQLADQEKLHRKELEQAEISLSKGAEVVVRLQARVSELETENLELQNRLGGKDASRERAKAVLESLR